MTNKNLSNNIILISFCIMIISAMFIFFLGSSEDILININYAFKITSLVGIVGIIYGIYKTLSSNQKKTNNKKIFAFIGLILLFYFLIGDKIIASFTHYQNPANACYYLNKCDYDNYVSYQNDKYYIIADLKNTPFYYSYNGNYWNSHSKDLELKYMYEDNSVLINIFSLDTKYFIVVKDKNDTALDIKDTSEINFENLSFPRNKDVKIKNFYGKIVDTIDDYEITINGENKKLRKL